MAVSMKAIVLLNLATEADIVNGTQGEIQDIILDEREEMLVVDENGADSILFLDTYCRNFLLSSS